MGGLLLLFIFIYAILAMNFFSTVKFAYPLIESFNFNTVLDSIVALFVIHTGDKFYEMYNQVKIESSIIFECINNPTY